MASASKGWATPRNGLTAAVIACAILAILALNSWRLSAKDEPNKELPADLAWVPADALGFVQVQVGELWKNEAVKRLVEQRGNSLKEMFQGFEKQFGMPPTDLERAILVMFAPNGTASGPPIVGILTSTKAFNREKVLQGLAPNRREATVDGKKVYVATEPQGAAVCFVNDRLLIVGSMEHLPAILNAPAKPNAIGGLGAALKLAAEKHHIVAGANLPESVTQELKKIELPRQARGLKPAFEAKSATLTADFGEELVVKLTGTFADEAKAKEGMNAVRLGQVLFQLVASPAIAEMRRDQELRNAAELMKQVLVALGTTVIEQRENTVYVTVKIKTDIATVTGAMAETTVKVREAADRWMSASNMRQILIAMHNHASDNRTLPARAIFNKNGKPLLSWRVLMLPYLDGGDLYKAFKLDEPWDSPNNKKLLERMPKFYAPVGVTTKEPFTTYYQLFTGKDTVFEDNKEMTLSLLSSQDGTSKTAILFEAGEAVPWTKPVDLVYHKEQPLPKLGGMFKGGFHIGFGDGSTAWVKNKFDESIMRLIITPNDGQTYDFDKLSP